MKPSLPFLLSVAWLLLLAACSESLSPAEEGIRDQVLLINNGAEPSGLDHHRATDLVAHHVLMGLMEGLVSEHINDSNKVEPGVAERWEHSEDFRLWTFHLRQDARWSNGDPVNAHDFYYGHRRILRPEFGAPYSEMLYIIKGAEAFNKGQIDDFSQVGIEVLDDYTIRYSLVGPAPFFVNMHLHYTYWPVHRPTIEKFDAFNQPNPEWTRPGNFVGNGPFVMQDWRVNDAIELVKSPTYWDRDAVRLNGITFFPVTDPEAEIKMFESGQLHKTNTVPLALRDNYKANRPDITRLDPYFYTSYVGCHTLKPPLDDPRVRRALSFAIDRGVLTKDIARNGEPARGFVPQGVEGYEHPSGLVRFDPQEARRLLAEAGFPDGNGFRELNLTATQNENTRMVAEFFQAQWREHLGINVRITNKEWKVFLDDTKQGNFDLFLLQWIGDYVDPSTFLNIMISESGNNRTRWSNPAYDALIAQARQIAQPQARLDLLEQAEAILLQDAPILPTTWGYRFYLLHPAVQNWAPKILSNQAYKYVYLREPDDDSAYAAY